MQTKIKKSQHLYPSVNEPPSDPLLSFFGNFCEHFWEQWWTENGEPRYPCVSCIQKSPFFPGTNNWWHLMTGWIAIFRFNFSANFCSFRIEGNPPSYPIYPFYLKSLCSNFAVALSGHRCYKLHRTYCRPTSVVLLVFGPKKKWLVRIWWRKVANHFLWNHRRHDALDVLLTSDKYFVTNIINC